MSGKAANLSNTEITFGALSATLDELAEEKRLKFLIKLVMILSDRICAPDVVQQAIAIARKNL